MFQPGVSDLHVDALLTNLSLGVFHELDDYVATQVFPNVPVRFQSNLIPRYNEDAWLSVSVRERAPGTESEGSGWTVSKSTYFCRNFATAKDIPYEAMQNADAPWRLDQEATMWCVDQMLRFIETRFASIGFVATAWSTTSTPSPQWSASNSDPLKDVENAKIAVAGKIIREPNVAVMNRDVMGALKQNAALLNRIVYTQRGVLTEDLLASLFGLDRILIARAIQKTGAIKSKVFGNNFLLVYRPDSPSLMTPSAGYTFWWNALQNVPGAQGFSQDGVSYYVRRFSMQERLAQRIEIQAYFDIVVTSPDAGALLTNVV